MNKIEPLDEVDLKVKELLGINPYPNTCEICGNNYQVSLIEINLLDGNVYCANCHQPLKLGRVNHQWLKKNQFKMNTIRRKKK